MDAATVVWLGVFVAILSFVVQYAVWGLPFFLLAGFVWQTASAQLALLVPTAITYGALNLGDLDADIYVPLMTGVWVMWFVALVVLCASLIRGRRPSPGGVQPPLVRFSAVPP